MGDDRQMLTQLAPAKVNLFLHVGAAKANGRHDLDSLVMFADDAAADRLSVAPSAGLQLNVTGVGIEALGPHNDNLVLKAAHALREASGIKSGATITLDKYLPVAAGIGGGSADAGAALRLLTQMWEIDPAHAATIAPSLGGDVPVALAGQSAFMRGEGEQVLRLSNLPPLPAVLVNPNIACPTGAVFSAFDATGSNAKAGEAALPERASDIHELTAWLCLQRNDLEASALKRQPLIGEVLEALSAEASATLTRMSGSGATCFSLFNTPAAATEVAARLAAVRPDWWVQATVLGALPS